MSDRARNRPKTTQPRNPLAVAAITIATIAVVFAYMPLAFFVSLPLAMLSMGLAVMARRVARRPSHQGRGHEMAIVAFFTGLFAFVLGLLSLVATWNATRLPPGLEQVTSSAVGS